MSVANGGIFICFKTVLFLKVRDESYVIEGGISIMTNWERFSKAPDPIELTVAEIFTWWTIFKRVWFNFLCKRGTSLESMRSDICYRWWNCYLQQWWASFKWMISDWIDRFRNVNFRYWWTVKKKKKKKTISNRLFWLMMESLFRLFFFVIELTRCCYW